MTFASELFNARWHEERSCFLKALCCILLVIPDDFARFSCNMLLQNACKNHQNMLEKSTKMVPKWSPNLSKMETGGGLEATWEPSLKRGGSKMGPATPQISQDAPKRSLTWPKRAARRSQDGQVGAQDRTKMPPRELKMSHYKPRYANIDQHMGVY